jgi:uncharacterized protein (DUF433 family)
MYSREVTLHLPDELCATIEEVARRTGRAFGSVASELLTEAVKARRVAGITFTDGTQGRVARVAGSGLEVWEIVERYRAVGEDWELLKQEFDWLTEPQLRAALAHAAAYPEEIEARLAQEAHWTPERIKAASPLRQPAGQ